MISTYKRLLLKALGWSQAYIYRYPRPSVTATILLVGPDQQVLWGLRQPTADAYPNTLCLVGGFLNAKTIEADMLAPTAEDPGETIEETAIRETFEETGIVLKPEQLILIGSKSHPNTDPRAHVVNLCYAAILTRAQMNSAKAGDDLQALVWKPLQDGTFQEPFEAAFNHMEIALEGLAKLAQYQHRTCYYCAKSQGVCGDFCKDSASCAPGPIIP